MLHDGVPDLVQALLNIDELVLIVIGYQPVELLNEVLLGLQRLVLFHRGGSRGQPVRHSHRRLASAVILGLPHWSAVRSRGGWLGFAILGLLLLGLAGGQLFHIIGTF